jgi:hypothetical protein
VTFGRFLFITLLLTPSMALAQRAALQGTAPIRGGVFEASGVVAVPGTSGALFVDDGSARHVWWMDLNEAGVQQGPAVAVPLGLAVPDLEDITSDGTYFYVVGSQSKREGLLAPGLVRFTFDPRTKRVSDVRGATDLTGFLRRRVPELAVPVGRRVAPLNIEGLTWDPAGKQLLLGLREPMAGADALVVALRLPPAALASFDLNALGPGDVTVLRLGSRGSGIRGLGYDVLAKRVLALVGPAGERGGRESFRLLSWDPSGAGTPTPIASFPQALKPEGVTRMTWGGRSRTLVVCDSSRYLFLD